MKKYGTIDYYTEMFADFIGDVQHDSPELTENLIIGFKRALEEWRDYYSKQVIELDRALDLTERTLDDKS